jgi:hypothetical protein
MSDWAVRVMFDLNSTGRMNE